MIVVNKASNAPRYNDVRTESTITSIVKVTACLRVGHDTCASSPFDSLMYSINDMVIFV